MILGALSLSVRRAWIEICGGAFARRLAPVALRKESVDRNLTWHCKSEEVSYSVALRKESVDRNYYSDKDADWVRVSLSVRRAWIEIKYAL